MKQISYLAHGHKVAIVARAATLFGWCSLPTCGEAWHWKLMKRHTELDAIYCGLFDRTLLDVKSRGWNKQKPVDVLLRALSVRINQGRDGSLKPLGRLAREDLRQLVEHIAAVTGTDQQPTS